MSIILSLSCVSIVLFTLAILVGGCYMLKDCVDNCGCAVDNVRVQTLV